PFMRYYLTICLLLALTGIRAWGADDLQSLLAKPPFDAAPSAAAPAGSTGPIEFRGVLREGQRWSFCIYNVQAKSSAWVGLQETGQTYFVKSYDPAKETVQVEFSQGTYTIPLRIATTPTTAPAMAGGPVPGRVSGQPTGGPVPISTTNQGTGPAVMTSGNPDPNAGGQADMRTIERLAREAARLRAERARNLNSNPAPATPPKQ
ncbi:MAG TPA: hypothetical protein VFJ90_04385, partial [Candidatus Didemnitutus sp.]|nr:hypothetical protein [Candidatus Didemnitutus sp.]